ncbi:sugar phosphate isomerase/epimerase family protein [Cryptosporangium aurantiacum]|uniref:Sugar phosphate isomerase/epimerase n=1 Tax=Cryptosporangium aurantiacum TaxID=134849 RepID=A0A1M7P7B6_9ACTN|nr:sugar phosphate isomerase/epimerase [Cryptosporangium aurantiacum]SHN12596.1 Sugar phosphate isomerase/epimerase [Cryptosporangium aurantiacum]
MLTVGIFTGIYQYDHDEAARRARAHGFGAVQFDLDFTKPEYAENGLSEDEAKRIKEIYRSHDLPIVSVSGYTNIIHPDLDERERRLERLRGLIRNGRALGTPYVISETGTYNLESDWAPDPANFTEARYAETLDVIGGLVEVAAAHDAVFCVETYVNNVIGTIDATLRLFRDINSPHLGLVMDPTNYYEDHNLDDMDGVLKRLFAELGSYVKIAHAKDVGRATDSAEKHADTGAAEYLSFRGVGAMELGGPGSGALNYPLFLSLLAQQHPNMPVIIEHVTEDEVPAAKDFVYKALAEAGV